MSDPTQDRKEQIMSTGTKELQKLITHYCEVVGDQVTKLQTLLQSRLISTAKPEDVARNLHAEVHRMCGAAHCMGFRDFGNQLSKIERKLKKALPRPRRQIMETLDDLEDRFSELTDALDELQPDNSRVLQIMAENAPAKSETPADEIARQKLATRRILIADDDPFVREVLVSNLTEFGISNLRTVASGLEVLGAVADFQPDIIVTDWQMEPISGFELLQFIRSGSASVPAATPIIFFTGEQDRSMMQMALTNGADRFLRKPVSPDILLKSLIHIVHNGPVWRGEKSA